MCWEGNVESEKKVRGRGGRINSKRRPQISNSVNDSSLGSSSLGI